MATLSAPYWNTITPEMQQLLTYIGDHSFSQRFYLAGGTALSLQIGHRRSIDFDFFSATDDLDDNSRNEIIRGVSSHPTEIIETVPGNLLMLVVGIRVGFFAYGYPLIEKPVRYNEILLASLPDIGLMKCDALISRGSRKDFYDLFYLSRHIQLEDLMPLGTQKFTLFRDFPLMVLESMTLFDNADRDVQPELLENISWDEVKQYFINQAHLLGTRWFG